jgi:hypothetical protein
MMMMVEMDDGDVIMMEMVMMVTMIMVVMTFIRYIDPKYS